MKDEGARAFAEVLKTNTTLTTLKLGSNWLGDDGATCFAEALKTNVTLTRLDLCDNRIGDDGASALAKSLETNKTLSTLSLGGNDLVGDEGVVALANAIKINKTLTTLLLSENYTHTQGLAALSEALQTNTTITMVRYGNVGNVGNDGVLNAIEQMLERNRYLVHLNGIVAVLPKPPAGSISVFVDVLADSMLGIHSLSISFELLRARAEWLSAKRTA